MGGHLAKVETSPAGVTWGIGNDNTPWVYTGSFGGGFFKGKIYVDYSKKANKM